MATLGTPLSAGQHLEGGFGVTAEPQQKGRGEKVVLCKQKAFHPWTYSGGSKPTCITIMHVGVAMFWLVVLIRGMIVFCFWNLSA